MITANGNFVPVLVKDSTIEDFISYMHRCGGDPQTCIALLAAAYLYVYYHGAEPGVSLEACLKSFATTVLTLDAGRKTKS